MVDPMLRHFDSCCNNCIYNYFGAPNWCFKNRQSRLLSSSKQIIFRWWLCYTVVNLLGNVRLTGKVNVCSLFQKEIFPKKKAEYMVTCIVYL